MKFILDEDVPLKLLRALRGVGHDVVRAERSAPDPAIARRAREEARVLITLDKDFTNTSLYPPERFTIVHIKIHPPYAPDIVEAFVGLLDRLPVERFHGLIVLGKAGSIRVTE